MRLARLLVLALLLGRLAACASAPSERSSSTPAAAEARPADGEAAAAPAEAAPTPAPTGRRIEFDGRLIQPKQDDVSRLTAPEYRAAPTPAEPPRILASKEEPTVGLVLEHYGTNPTVETRVERTSTFSIDVDTAGYTMARGTLREGFLPSPAMVRVEEVVNAFRYDYPPPQKEPFSVVAEAFPSPHRKGYHVLLLGLKGREIEERARPPANLVFVIDVSGSMDQGDRLGTVKHALNGLVDRLREDDAVTIVVYGSTARVHLPPASGAEKDRIRFALERLVPEGSTNVQAGLMLAYEAAKQRAGGGRVTRLILCSDGVANNGVTDADGILATVDKQAQKGMALTTVGFGMGNYNDVLMERLAVKGQGRYVYVDDRAEAKRVFHENLSGTLVNIAADVKIQVEMDPSAVERWRLIGFENRKLQAHEFADDKVDAGEIGAGHEVTALYEVKLKPGADRIGWLRVRAKAPGATESRLIEEELTTRLVRPALASASGPSRLALVAAAFGEKLRGSYWVRNLSWASIDAQWRALPPELRARADVKELGQLIGVARRLDASGDRFERELPVAQMDFDRLPGAPGQ